MKRKLYTQLLEWKKSTRRKPLMLYGARQVGKTYLLKEFGRNEYDNLIYINCYRNPEIESLFKKDKDARRIISGLEVICREEIKPHTTLIFFDEIQDIPEVVAELKYFCEDTPEYHIVSAGSLLGVMNMNETPFPTGKVNIMHMFPMTFEEFLDAASETQGLKVLTDSDSKELVNSLLSRYTDLLREYYFVGGMPEAVLEYTESHNIERVRQIQNDILEAYDSDIAKHAGSDTPKARLVFQSIPNQLAKANRFVFNELKKGSRAADYENAIQWLIDAGLIYKVNKVSKPALPLHFYFEKNNFKLYLLDVGLLGAMAKAAPSLMLINNNVFTEFKGAFTENYVLGQLYASNCDSIAYYAKEKSTLEIDFLVQLGDKLLPIEVKAEENVKSKSLRQFITIDQAAQNLHGYRFSMLGYADQDWMSNIPLPAVETFIKEIKGSGNAVLSAR